MRILRVKQRTAQSVTEAFGKILRHKATCVRTITMDNGKEFAGDWEIERILQARVSFADPYSAWQRGTNENTNGLIRQYILNSRLLGSVADE
ncbi:IS30 family transposase [Aphanothece stagnina]|uniref:IS30 family transposase n=1 Tax=Aphanothece stagnina TaxID=1004305 RepID=UPI00398F3762